MPAQATAKQAETPATVVMAADGDP